MEEDPVEAPDQKNEEQQEPLTGGRAKLHSWLNKSMRVRMTDGRTLVGVFVCTDKDRNVILGSCHEYLKLPEEGDEKEEPRVLGLAMIPGHHIVSIEVDVNKKEFLPEAAIGSRNSMDCDMAEEPAPTACEGATA